jgi:outer membrane receptor for ferrienterochelin and colicins
MTKRSPLRWPRAEARLVRAYASAIVLFAGAAPSALAQEPSDQEPGVPAPRLTPPSLVERAEAAVPPGIAHGGRVLLRLTIAADGHVEDATVVEADDPALGEAAREAALRSRFTPATRDGAPVPSRVLFAYELEPPAEVPAEAPPVEEGPAPESSPEESPVEVVVTGTRAERSRAASVVAVELIGRAEIERSGARNAAELLEERAGLQINRTYAGSELRLRGLDPEYTLVLVDGERVPGRIGGAIDLSRYAVEDIERVEVVRGPSSALYGSDAIGGVVNIVTRDSTRKVEADAMASYGSRGVADATGRVAYRPTRAIGLELTGGTHFARAFGDDGQVATTGSSRRQWSLGGRLDARAGERHRFIARVSYQRLTLEGVDTGAGAAVFDRTQEQEQLQASISHRADPSARVRVETRASYSQFREQYLLDQRGSAQLDSYQDNREHMIQGSTLVDIHPSARHATTVGVEYLFQSLDSVRLERDGERHRFALFGQHEMKVYEHGASALTLVPGVRLDIDSQFGQQVSPKLSVRYDPIEQLTLRATYGRGFRAPSFQELLLRFENPSVGYVVSGNPDLGAERSHGVDFGVTYRPVSAFTLTASFFRNDLRDMIATVTVEEGGAGGTLFSYANISSAHTMGLESTATVRVKDLFDATLGYTFTDTLNGETGRPLEGQPRHRITLSPHFTYEPWELDVTARAALLVQRQYDVDTDGDGVSTQITAPPIAQIDLRVAKSFTRHFELFVGVDNLINAGDQYTILQPLTVYGGARGRY